MFEVGDKVIVKTGHRIGIHGVITGISIEDEAGTYTVVLNEDEMFADDCVCSYCLRGYYYEYQIEKVEEARGLHCIGAQVCKECLKNPKELVSF